MARGIGKPQPGDPHHFPTGIADTSPFGQRITREHQVAFPAILTSTYDVNFGYSWAQLYFNDGAPLGTPSIEESNVPLIGHNALTPDNDTTLQVGQRCWLERDPESKGWIIVLSGSGTTPLPIQLTSPYDCDTGYSWQLLTRNASGCEGYSLSYPAITGQFLADVGNDLTLQPGRAAIMFPDPTVSGKWMMHIWPLPLVKNVCPIEVSGVVTGIIVEQYIDDAADTECTENPQDCCETDIICPNFCPNIPIPSLLYATRLTPQSSSCTSPCVFNQIILTGGGDVLEPEWTGTVGCEGGGCTLVWVCEGDEQGQPIVTFSGTAISNVNLVSCDPFCLTFTVTFHTPITPANCACIPSLDDTTETWQISSDPDPNTSCAGDIIAIDLGTVSTGGQMINPNGLSIPGVVTKPGDMLLVYTAQYEYVLSSQIIVTYNDSTLSALVGPTSFGAAFYPSGQAFGGYLNVWFLNITEETIGDIVISSNPLSAVMGAAEIVRGLASGILDKSVSAHYASSSPPVATQANTGSTATTSTAKEYWKSVFFVLGGGSSWLNGFIDSGQDITDTGYFVPPIGPGDGATYTMTGGDQVVDSTGTAHGELSGSYYGWCGITFTLE